jgi:vesicle coat complex subunit
VRLFKPLKKFFDAEQNGPIRVKNFFTNDSGLFWLKFVEGQLVLSNRYVLRTESRDVAAFEVAVELAELRQLVNNRKNNVYIVHEAQNVLSNLEFDDQEDIRKRVVDFYNGLDSLKNGRKISMELTYFLG